MKQQARQGADHQNDRQGAKGEDEGAAGAGLRKGQGPAAEIAEDERAALECGGAERAHRLVQVEQPFFDERRLEQQQADDELQHDGDADQLPVDAADVARHRQHEGDEDGDAEQRL